MKKNKGRNVQVKLDNTGGLIFVDWECPYCGGYNSGMYYSSDAKTLSDDFEVDHECDDCGKMVTIVCDDAEREYTEK